MKIRRALFGGAVALLVAAVISVTIHGQTPAAPTGFITGVVQGAKGPEAGVWVIAETKDLPTNFIKIVVTDDQGRFMLPELPSASYSVFVRGYGIADSERQTMKPAGSVSKASARCVIRPPIGISSPPSPPGYPVPSQRSW